MLSEVEVQITWSTLQSILLHYRMELQLLIIYAERSRSTNYRWRL
jgi:hypothetical protein